jgi:hypothetical protein
VLLADVALARMRPDSEPANTGSLRGDLLPGPSNTWMK